MSNSTNLTLRSGKPLRGIFSTEGLKRKRKKVMKRMCLFWSFYHSTCLNFAILYWTNYTSCLSRCRRRSSVKTETDPSGKRQCRRFLGSPRRGLQVLTSSTELKILCTPSLTLLGWFTDQTTCSWSWMFTSLHFNLAFHIFICQILYVQFTSTCAE